MLMPASVRMGAPTRASLEQVVPTTAKSWALEASLAAAACPPSGLQPVSSPTISIGWPRISPPMSATAISMPRFESTPSEPFGPEVTIA